MKTMHRAVLAVWACMVVGTMAAQDVKGSGIDHPDDDAPGREEGNLLDAVDEKGLHTYTKLNGSLANLDHILDTIKLNRTTAYLNCSQGFMQVDLKFMEPFYGIAYADYDRNSACITKGRGLSTARIEMPLKGCGTKQGPPRVFTNNIVVRFHPFLEMDGDEVITIICRYPPAIAPIPKGGPIAGPILSEDKPFFTPLFIVLMVCTLLFLALTLAGLGCSYLCLRGRPVTIVHRKAYTGSDITKLSGSSVLSRPSMFDDFKIPRIMSTQQGYGSEAHLVIDQSDTLPSDYPSESHSEVDEERSLPVSSAGSYETKAFINQQVEQRASSSLYSETINEVESTAIMASRITQSRHPMAMPMEHKFDVQMRVKSVPAPPSPLPSESDASLALERNLTTILEREEMTRTSIESPPPRLTTFSYVPELHAPPSTSRQQTPPVYSRILRKQAERSEIMTETVGPPIQRPRSLASLNTELTETRSLTEVTDASHAKYRVASMLAPSSPPPQPTMMSSHLTEEYRELTREQVEPLVEPVVASRRPEITTHEVDDVFLRTITEKKTIEDIERHRRQILEYQARQQPLPDPKWDVTIRNYPTGELTPPGPPEWENFSDVSSASNLTVTLEPAPGAAPKGEEPPIDVPVQPTYTARADIPTRRSSPRMSEEQERSTGTTTWYNLERVLEAQYVNEFTEEERTKWREIITTESTLRTLLTEAIVKEDYELIRKDSRYVNLFPPAKWDVIIRIISPPSNGSISSSSHGKGSGQRYKRTKSSEWDTRSRRSSLPTLYEYESDGGSLVHDQLRAAAGPGVPGTRIRKLSSTTRGGSEADLRSMSEMTVRDFARLERDEITSLSSFEGDFLVRSLSQPSLARSGSEFTEHWGLPARNLPQWDMDDEPCTSTDTTPRPIRRGLAGSEEVSSSRRQESSSAAATASSSFARSTRYSSEQRHQSSSSQQQQQQQRGSWTFHDDSEPEMQI